MKSKNKTVQKINLKNYFKSKEKPMTNTVKDINLDDLVSLEELAADSKANKSKEFLQEAHSIIYGDRHEEYGDAANNFTDIANMWTDYNGGYKFRKENVAIMMILVKIARCHYKISEDSLRDIVGYCTLLHRFKFIDND
tara:strand:+ start:348 stop:764 length:417 start_codon:yes stop_codon:yes gene_type:complete